ncbi:3-oxoacyl-[acyl-carrier-protein] reductase [Microlunatus phosphovorus NM-1]|uniref:3-oxoacyl-[acyl-carrier-protein] reductase n=1 Tax=Microlunatus phosphovorus (strain ATCC 700054 / DSM 10555 / JCM 9379 / NBRC 101784 / NCIMB 13414 / VKM Ac-1990 / NM-1) TaxID=1032480 RepID=F5XP77_MICPN|nr:3-oxoacyl-ACP reductase FabG [Microlunatus phosphovorus]BAK36717.1 3-oxoacyl-[acyl-carrier-protein] reductase [Microlunatus phosphovorus NM-1]
MTTSRVAVVTGAARGIGAAIARRLAAGGAAVAAVDLNTDGAARTANAIAESGGRAIAIGADVGDEDAASRAVERAAAELGPVTILVNNAGIIRDNLLFKMTSDDWDAVMNVHLRGAFLMTRAAQAHMIEAKWGRIVNLSSTSALGNRGQVNYAAAKAGIQGFTKTLALELGKFGVTANAIAPGFIDTEMTQATADRLGVDFEDWKAAVSREIPVGRVGTPDDIAAVAAFLCGEDAGYVSGQVIYVAGGPRA